jgi:RNA polymerase sigma-70 factor (ECF subfamily)
MNPHDAERELVAAAQAGDHGAFTTLLRAHDDQMRGLAYRMLGSRAAMDDALQDAYLKAYRSLGGFDGRSQFATWLHRVVVRVCLDHLRKTGRRSEVGLEAVGEPATQGPEIGDRLAARQELQAALDALAPDAAAAVLLVDGEGLSYAEAAATLGVANGTIASRLGRGRAQLRVLLGMEDPTGPEVQESEQRTTHNEPRGGRS